jgi:hypothetical protein
MEGYNKTSFLSIMKFLLVIVVVSFMACKEGIQYPEGGYDYPRDVTGRDTSFYYYPP